MLVFSQNLIFFPDYISIFVELDLVILLDSAVSLPLGFNLSQLLLQLHVGPVRISKVLTQLGTPVLLLRKLDSKILLERYLVGHLVGYHLNLAILPLNLPLQEGHSLTQLNCLQRGARPLGTGSRIGLNVNNLL